MKKSSLIRKRFQIHFTIILIITIFLVCSISLARTPIRKAFFQAYPTAKNSVLDDVASHAGHCGVCHYDFGGSGPKNPYGEAVAATDRSKDGILGIGGDDSDGDGFTNDEEIIHIGTYINTPTFPGLTPSNISMVTNVNDVEVSPYLVPSTGVDTNEPNVVVIEPNGGETYVGNVNDTIQWLATDTGGISSIDLYVSIDNGATFKPIELGVENTGSYEWFPANRPTTQAIVRVVATDNSLNVVTIR
ncbi:MAG: hypothetical protein ACYTFM_11530 [Planctomycetota bacterium]|jgi:hypothetical protein